jgi:hypothetical protein
MKFKLCTQISNVKSFKAQNTHLLINSNGELKDNFNKIAEGVDTLGYFMFDEMVVYIKEEKSFIKNDIIDRPFIYNSFNDIDYTAIFTDDFSVDDFTLNLYLYSLVNKNEIGDLGRYKFLKQIINTSSWIVFSVESVIISHSKHDCKRLWQFDISQIGEFITPFEIKPAEVEQLIGVYNQILWVHLGNGKVIGLNIETGNLEHELSDTPETNIHNGILKPLADGGKRERLVHYHFDEAKGKIFGLSYNSYCEINLKCNNPQFEIWLLNNQMESFGIKEIYRYSAKDEDGNLYFFDSNECKWGVFNTTTKSIEWVSEKINNSSNPKVFMQLKEIQYGAGRVYILDTNQVLHVFEKE